MNRTQTVRFAAFVTVLAVLLGYVVYHRSASELPVGFSTAARHRVRPASSGSLQRLENYFVNYRMHRDKVMSQEIATLKGVLNNPALSREAKSEAAQTMVRDTQELKQEAAIEGLLSAQGFPLTAVTVTRNSAVVVVGADHLSSTQVARIADAVMKVTHFPPENVVILPKAE
ncbi:MAG: SpoIIIAH-like family protein [Firmicutes bacterium]|nr:SpoIIIAH-like family protein [Bacillota bacterium]